MTKTYKTTVEVEAHQIGPASRGVASAGRKPVGWPDWLMDEYDNEGIFYHEHSQRLVIGDQKIPDWAYVVRWPKGDLSMYPEKEFLKKFKEAAR